GNAARVSRLLIVSDDGSERFSRQVGLVLHQHGRRLLALRLRFDAGHLGAMLFGNGRTAKAVCVSHKAAVASVLLALVEPVHRAVPAAPDERPPQCGWRSWRFRTLPFGSRGSSAMNSTVRGVL